MIFFVSTVNHVILQIALPPSTMEAEKAFIVDGGQPNNTNRLIIYGP
jgi:hypothetical protein